MRIFYVLLISMGLSSCTTVNTTNKKGASSFSFLNTYESALEDYQSGRVMEARNRILAMDKTREDYAQAKRLLNRQVEPARVRLLKHYSRKAKASEKKKTWSQAMRLYEQTASFSMQSKKWLKKKASMEMKFRQLRMNKLLAQRRQEDSALLKWLNNYDVPRGVPAKDNVFERMHDRVQEVADDRSNLAYADARRYVNRGMFEVAYIEAESYLRMNPDSGKGQRLMVEIKNEIPKGIYIASVKTRKKTPSKLTRRTKKLESVTVAQVKALMAKSQWLKAKKFASVYRREGGKDADRLLKKIQIRIEKEAAMLFAKGEGAFRREHLDQAVEYWERAVVLMPNQAEYVDALQRALQLQERLGILKTDKISSK
ncbi:MAG: 4-hydroxy-3-methylbut-2-en-1-yl diphosphate synthase [Mariprofundaceae bacterium]